MSALVKINDTYYFRLRIPKDLRTYFHRSEIVKSTRTTKYRQAKGLARSLLGKIEALFMVIRSKALDDAVVTKIVREFVESTLELKYDKVDELVNSPDSYDSMQEIYADAQKSILKAVKDRSEVGGWHMMGFTGVAADYLCHSAGYDIEEETPQFKKLVHQLAIAKKEIIQTLQERLDTGDSAYDSKQRIIKEKKMEELGKSNTLSELIAAYCRSKEGVTGKGRKSKLSEKMDKIMECFQLETGKQDLLLSEITYDLTERVGRMIAKYPLYRNSRYKGKTLIQIFAMEDIEHSSNVTAREELYRLSGLYDFAVSKLEGLRKNYAINLGEIILGKEKAKASSARDIFQPADIHQIIRVLGVFKDKGLFEKNPHLLFITLIGFYGGPRINEVCQLKIHDIMQVDGLWCFNHLEEESADKSLKNKNSIRTNPIHPVLLEFGLLRFRESQIAKGYTDLWDGAKNHRCDFYAKSGNCSHYVSKWWNGTFKAKLSLTNPEKQTFHSTRHTFINWFKQHVRPLDYEARNALSGHLDKDDLAALALQGYDAESEGEVTYSKGLNVKRQMELLEKLDYGIDLTPLQII